GTTTALDLVGHPAMPHREHLEAAGIADDPLVPAHELVQAAQLANQLRTRRQEQVEGIAEDQVIAQRGHFSGLERLDRAAGGQGHEGRSGHLSVRQVQHPGARSRGRVAGPDGEHQLCGGGGAHWPDRADPLPAAYLRPTCCRQLLTMVWAGPGCLTKSPAVLIPLAWSAGTMHLTMAGALLAEAPLLRRLRSRLALKTGEVTGVDRLPTGPPVDVGALGVPAGVGLLLLLLLDPQPASAIATTATTGATDRLIHRDIYLLLGRPRTVGASQSGPARSQIYSSAPT